MDLTRATATVRFDRTPATALRGDARSALDGTADLANVAIAAESFGRAWI